MKGKRVTDRNGQNLENGSLEMIPLGLSFEIAIKLKALVRLLLSFMY